MIKRISIRNFQSWREVDIDVTSKTVAIVGPSNCGKSAIIRALVWLVYNEPSGDKFRSNFSGRGATTSVEVTLTDGTIVKRLRSATANCATITYPNGKTVDLEKCGAGTVDAISKALNISAYAKQLQHDSAFLLSSKSSDLEKLLNGVCNYSFLDDVIDKIITERRVNQNELKDLESTISALSQLDDIDIDAFLSPDYVDRLISRKDECASASAKLSDILGMVRKAESVKALIVDTGDELDSLAEEMDNIRRTIDRLEFINTRVAAVRQVLDSSYVADEDISDAVNRKEMLDASVNRLRFIVVRVRAILRLLEQFDALSEDDADISNARSRLDAVRSGLDELSSINQSLTGVCANIRKRTRELDEVEDFLRSVNTCPLCGATEVHLV